MKPEEAIKQGKLLKQWIYSNSISKELYGDTIDTLISIAEKSIQTGDKNVDKQSSV